jgi:Ca-activated chloride channel family protein
MKWLALPLVLLAAAQPAASPPPPTPPEATVGDRLQWNARERTASGKSELEKGNEAGAVPAFDTALRLAPANPTARFNAGTARLGGDDAGALSLLEEATKGAPAELAPSAWYNLGNGRLATGDAEGAVKAYVEALRRQPEHENAKVNLELALRELERQRREQQQRRKERQDSSRKPPSKPDEGQNGQPESKEPRAEGSSQPQPSQPSEPSPGDSQPQPVPAAGNQPPQEGTKSLPQFHDLPDMTAEQAASILRAVENLERQQRRDRAEKEAAAKRQVEIDW